MFKIYILEIEAAMKKIFALLITINLLIITSCNSYKIVKVSPTPSNTNPPIPTYTPFPTYTPLPTYTPHPTDIPLKKLRPRNTSCLTEDMWVDAIRSNSGFDPTFEILPEDANWDQEWSLDESSIDGTGGIYDLVINEKGGCIEGAGTLILMDVETGDYSKRDLFMDFVRGFLSDTDGGTWFKEQINRCSNEDEVFEDKLMKDGTIWRVFCEYHKDHDIQMYSLIITLVE